MDDPEQISGPLLDCCRCGSVRVTFLLPLLCLAGVLFASDSWSKKPYLEWTEKEALQILTDSPWSKIWIPARPRLSSSAPAGTPAVESEDSGQHSNCCRTFGSGIGTAAADPRNTAASPSDNGPTLSAGGQPEWFRVSWFSSMHIRQALYRLRLINGAERDPGAELSLTQPADPIVLAISGPSMHRFQGASLDSLRASTRLLSRKNRDRAAQLQAFVPPQARPDHLAIFVFPRQFDAGDKELIFTTGEGPGRISVVFKLADMKGGGVVDY